ncbi:hypothetical protein AOCH_006445 [Aspergillus ochraceoroseus]|uniref:DUF3074 domain-containing protein n=1 Tax=Aspergillus ochraceoroseus TaxID=138278 RepID=A0A0F8UCM1_9EURO|nr:hypothetical protein AOCH_006445 [Aspergillus ochraceoroseus]
MPTSLLRSSPHPFILLPDHPSLGNNNTTTTTTTLRPPLRNFLHTTLTEAQTLLASVPGTFKPIHRKPRASAPSTAPVQLLSRTVPETGDFWVCRKSIHEDAAIPGSASWEEFRAGLRETHAENEMDYTPSVTSVETLLGWPVEGEIEGGWKGVEMHVNIITHTFHPTLLISPRSFVVLSISADQLAASSPPSDNGFVTIQVPLDATSPDSMPPALREKLASALPPSTIFASYASVEQVRLTSTGIEWVMATTSNAGGAIPQWVQRSWTMGGVPKAVVADVGLFLAWTARRRSQNP